jgi:hypothetical protein
MVVMVNVEKWPSTADCSPCPMVLQTACKLPSQSVPRPPSQPRVLAELSTRLEPHVTRHRLEQEVERQAK